MKTNHSLRVLACVAAVAAFSVAGSFAFADAVVVTHEAWTTDNTGYWDAGHVHHAFIMHENHRGYWRENNGTRVFINVD